MAGCRGRGRRSPVAAGRAGNGASEAPDVGGHVAVTGRRPYGAVAVVDGRVAAVGDTESVTGEYPRRTPTTRWTPTGGRSSPAFVNAYTHALFAGDRSDEFAAELRGESDEATARACRPRGG